MGLYIGLGVGVILLSCCVCGGGGGVGYYFWSQSNPLVGKWEGSLTVLGQDVKRELEFTSKGTGTLKVTVFKGLVVGKNEVIRESFKYTFTKGNPSNIEVEITSAEVGPIFLKDRIGRKERAEVTFDGDTMTLTDLNRKGPARRESLTYRRVR